MRRAVLLTFMLTMSLLVFGQDHSRKDECYVSHYGNEFKEYEGSYKIDNYGLVTVRLEMGDLLLRPGFWTTTQHLKRLDHDSFVVKRHERLSATFTRNGKGEVDAVELNGFQKEKGVYSRIKAGSHPVELILTGKVDDAIRTLKRDNANDEMMIDIGTTIMERIPSQMVHAKEYLEQLEASGLRHATLFRSLGDFYFSTGQTEKAIHYYRESLTADSTPSWATTALQMLHVLPYDRNSSKGARWQLPFALSELFKAPTMSEIDEVKNEWAMRDLGPRDVRLIERDTMMFGRLQSMVNIVSHRINGQIHYGAIIVPVNAQRKKFAAVVDLKGVSWNYFPLDLGNSDGVYSPQLLCQHASDFVYIVPSFRGEKLILKGKEYLSEGDRTNVWDGAADDGIALLNAALALFPEIDKEKIAAFGKSRGGTVALLMGIRDKRVKRVVDWAGPVDRFKARFRGWSEMQFVEAGVMGRSSTSELGGQFIETFLKESIDGKEGLAQARKRLLASSPLFFADMLPKVQIHYGQEDRIVPATNGEKLERETKTVGHKRVEAFYHKGEGHDLDLITAFGKSQEFLLQVLKSDKR